MYGVELIPAARAIMGDDPLLIEGYDMLGFDTAINASSQFKLNGEWITFDPTFTDELEASFGVPIPRFGEEHSWGVIAHPENALILEGLPYGFPSLIAFFCLLACGSLDGVNANLDKLREDGIKTLEEYGSRDTYNKRVKKSQVKLPSLPSIAEIGTFRNKDLG
jgi:hypothetical protein